MVMFSTQFVARHLLDFYAGDPKRWLQGKTVGTADGSKQGRVTCWCLTGALGRLVGSNKITASQEDQFLFEAVDFLALPCRVSWVDSIVKWNDAPERVFQDVQDLLTQMAGHLVP